jgi:hypothetical protein
MAVNGSSQGLTVASGASNAGRLTEQMPLAEVRGTRYEVAAAVGEMKSFLSVISKNSGRRSCL